ncbi:MAG: LysM peptidoglycan-binding domain-containing protein [Gemmatimonas sp.]
MIDVAGTAVSSSHFNADIVMPESNKTLPDFSDVKGGSSSEAMTREESRIQDQVYTVAAGDTLQKIAKRFLGDSSEWKKIWEANKAEIKNPDLIQIGQVLSIPKA